MINLLKYQKDTSLVLTYRAIFSTVGSRNPKEAKPYLDTALALGAGINNTKLQARLLTDQANHYSSIGNHAQAIEYFKSAIDSYASIDYLPMMQVNYNSLGIKLKYVGDLDGAMNAYMESLRISEVLGDSEYYKSPTYLNLGQLHAQLGNIELSNEYYKKSEEVCLEFNIPYCAAMSRSNMAENMITEQRYEEALSLFLSALVHFEDNNDFHELGEQYNYIGETYVLLDSLIKAEEYFKKSLLVSDKIDEKDMYIIAHRNLGDLSMKRNDINQALSYYNEGASTSKSTGNNLELLKFYSKTAEAYSKQGNHQRAFEYQRNHFVLYDSIFQKEKVQQINELEVKYQTAIKEGEIAVQEEEIKTLNEKAKVDKLTKGLYAGGMFSTLALSGLLVFGFRQRIKKNRIAREKQEEIYRKEIEHKQKELASQTLHLVQKNTFIQELKENLENIKNSPEKFKTEFRRIVMLLKKENASEKDWAIFKTYFADVHNDFDQKLKTLYADISEKEIRLAAFLRMNLTTKEIAATLNVLPDSIFKSKYRLKKKLGLDKETDLVGFLNTI